jgi:EAL domain-containing protein (putative c-di-GMP-specific phosphodiesterase class I)
MPVHSSTSSANSLNLVIQPWDSETRQHLCNLGFSTVPAVVQLVYRCLPPCELSRVFFQLNQCLPESSQVGSRYSITAQSPLNSTALLVDFLDARPLSTVTESIRYAWFLQVMAKQQLFVKFQPIFDLKRGEVVAYECLARAETEDGQCFGGQQLIDAAVSLRLTREFDELARMTSLEAIAHLRQKLERPDSPLFFINILPNSLTHTAHNLEQTLQPILDLGINPRQIVFELAETEIISRPPELPGIINRLRDWGVGFAIDDLYSNVSLDHYYLEFHPNVIKLDRRLVDKCGRYQLKQIIIKSLVTSAHELGIRVLAEGLEDWQDIEFCSDLGVDYGQGFGLALPERTLRLDGLKSLKC